MVRNQCISVTDLRTKTKKCLDGLKDKPKYVFINNRPVAVIVDIDEYEFLNNDIDLVELSDLEISDDLLREAKIARKIKKTELLNI